MWVEPTYVFEQLAGRAGQRMPGEHERDVGAAVSQLRQLPERLVRR
jgi:hypothetical protein